LTRHPFLNGHYFIHEGDIIMHQNPNLHTLSHVVINDLKKAYITSLDSPTEKHILSALVTAQIVHDQLLNIDLTTMDLDPEEYCSAV
jgi:hypothetical protein